MKQFPGTEINTIPFTLFLSNLSEKSSRNKKITHEHGRFVNGLRKKLSDWIAMIYNELYKSRNLEFLLKATNYTFLIVGFLAIFFDQSVYLYSFQNSDSEIKPFLKKVSFYNHSQLRPFGPPLLAPAQMGLDILK